MVLSEDEIHSVYEKYDDEEYPEYKAYIDTIDNSVTVLFKVDVYPTVEEAETHYTETKESYEEPKDWWFKDQSVKQTDGDHAEMIIRVSNAVGHVISYVPEKAPEDPDDRRTTPRGQVLAFAKDLRDYWAGTGDYRQNPGFCREEVKALQQPDEND